MYFIPRPELGEIEPLPLDAVGGKEEEEEEEGSGSSSRIEYSGSEVWLSGSETLSREEIESKSSPEFSANSTMFRLFSSTVLKSNPDICGLGETSADVSGIGL